MTFGSLFAGIGGLDLGLERAGLRCVWQVEIDDYCRRVLAKHWPDVRRHDDVKTFPPDGDWTCDLICGGFPCQDISTAGKMRGIKVGNRSGLWHEFARIVRVVRPGCVLVENVSALLMGGIGIVLGELAALGFDAEWDCIPAAAVGADHIRDRVFILAHRSGNGGRVFEYPTHSRCSPLWPAGDFWQKERKARERSLVRRRDDSLRRAGKCGVLPVANGVPDELERYRGLGNAVVPQVAEWIGRRLMEHVR